MKIIIIIVNNTLIVYILLLNNILIKMGINSIKLLNSINNMIKYNKFNNDYLKQIIEYFLIENINDFYYNEIITLIYSKIEFFKLVFEHFDNEVLYIPGEIFNNKNSILLTEILKQNTNIKHIIID